MPKNKPPQSSSPRWDALRPLVREVMRQEDSNLQNLCLAHGWNYNRTWVWFDSEKPPAPRTEIVLMFIQYVLATKQLSNRNDLLKIITQSK